MDIHEALKVARDALLIIARGAHDCPGVAKEALAATASIEQPAAVASVDGAKFRALLPDDLSRVRGDEIVAFVNDHCAQQVEAYGNETTAWQRLFDKAIKRAEVAEKERDELRAQLTARGEPVAQICDTWELRWIGAEPIAPIIQKHDLKIGDFLYAAKQPKE